MSDSVTDTHSLIWFLEDNPRLSPVAKATFDACDRGESIIYIPTICLVEIIYLQEKGRIPITMGTQLDAELRTGTTGFILADLTPEVANAIVFVPRADVADLPDRIIAATAVHLGLPLISKDRKIKLSGITTIW